MVFYADPEIFVGHFLIGADGARSAVRQSLNIKFDGKTYPETTILVTTKFPFHEQLEGLSNVNYVWKSDGTFSLLRLPNLWRCSLYPDEGETIEDALVPDNIARKLELIVPGASEQGFVEARSYRIHKRRDNVDAKSSQ